MPQRTKKLLPAPVCALLLATFLILSATSIPAMADSGGPGFNNPKDLCNAMVHLSTKGWHHDFLGWGCISSLKRFGPSQTYSSLPSTFQYAVSGDSYETANKVKLFYTANNPSYLNKSLEMMATYAKELSSNTAFHLSKKMLSKIKRGIAFQKKLKGATIRFKVNKGHVDVYKLIISPSRK